MQPGLGESRREHAREHGIRMGVALTKTVERGLTDPRGVECEHTLDRLDAGEPALAADRAQAWPFERVVAAGVENNDGNPHPARLEIADDVGLRQRCTREPGLLTGVDVRYINRQDVGSAA